MKSKDKRILWVVLGMAAVVVMMVASIAICVNDMYNRIYGTVTYNPLGHYVEITNTDTCDWSQMRMTLDDDWHYTHREGLRAGGYIRVIVIDFLDENGRMFDMSRTPHKLVVETAEGKGAWEF